MHPHIAQQLITQHHKDLAALAGQARPRRARPALGLPHWRITWSWVASPADAQGGRAWLIVISARRGTGRATRSVLGMQCPGDLVHLLCVIS
jgi:hypothetical protein